MKISSPPAQKRIGVGALARALGREPHALLIDVRSPAEFNTAHIQQARLHPLPDLRPADLLKDLPAGEAIYVICQSGARAMKAIARFEDAGFQQVSWLKEEWMRGCKQNCQRCVLVEADFQYFDRFN